MVEQNDTRCHRPGWYAAFSNFLLLPRDIQSISLTGFNYKFNSLSTTSEKSELIKAFDIVFRAGNAPGMVPILKAMVPALRFLASSCFMFYY